MLKCLNRTNLTRLKGSRKLKKVSLFFLTIRVFIRFPNIYNPSFLKQFIFIRLNTYIENKSSYIPFHKVSKSGTSSRSQWTPLSEDHSLLQQQLVRPEVALEISGVRRKTLSQGVAGSLSGESTTKFGTRLEKARNDATERAVCDLHREGIERTSSVVGCWVTSMKRRTKIVAASFVRSSVLYALRGRSRPLPLRARVRSPHSPHLSTRPFSPRGLSGGGGWRSVARPGFDRASASKRRKIVARAIAGRDRFTQKSTPDAAHRA